MWGPPRPGSTRSGDSLFPAAGNGGYQAAHYRVVLHYRPAGNGLRAAATMRAQALHPLSSFSLDLEGLRVRRVSVEGRAATFERRGHELVVTPARPVRGRFTSVVEYAGHPRSHTDPDGSSEGWIRTRDGATALGEPVGTMTWIPVNNTPRDKARYTFRVTAPSRLSVAANGVLSGLRRNGHRTTWTWRTDPMASYLAMVSIGDYRVFHSSMRTATGRRLPVWSFVDRRLRPQRHARHALPPILRWEDRTFGRYPFRSTGLVAHRLEVGYALETQNRPTFAGQVRVSTLVHELAHQWFGDSVTLRDWQDIWLNEGFATYAEWLWQGRHGGPSPARNFRHLYRTHGPHDALWGPAPARFSDPADLFGAPVYERGAMTMQALRERVGRQAFFHILRAWARQHRHGTVTTAQFVRLSEAVSGRQLGALFRDWLYTARRPRGY